MGMWWERLLLHVPRKLMFGSSIRLWDATTQSRVEASVNLTFRSTVRPWRAEGGGGYLAHSHPPGCQDVGCLKFGCCSRAVCQHAEQVVVQT